MVHRFLVTGLDEQLFAFHVPLCAKLNAVERRGQTVLYTCMDEDRELALEVARTVNATVQEWDGEEWAVIAGEGPGWEAEDEPCARG